MRSVIPVPFKVWGFTTSGVSIGILLIVAGLLVPSSAIIQSIRTIPPTLLQPLLAGGTLFKIGLVILGLMVIALIPTLRAQPRSRSDKSPLTSDSKLRISAVLLLLLVAAALRLYSLDVGLWHDEISAYLQYAKLPLGEIITFYDSENQHILYSLLAQISFKVFGEGAWALRLPAAVFGVGSIGALYLLGRQVGSFREALLSAALLTFSYHHIWFSQNARGYTALLFFAVLASCLLLRAMKESRLLLWLLFAVATALGVYAHLTMLFVTIGHFTVYLAALWFRRRQVWPNRWNGLVWGFGLAGLLTFQLYALVLPQVLTGLKDTVSVVSEWKQPLWTMIELANGLQVSFAGGLLAAGVLLVFGAGVLSYTRTSPALIQMLIIPPVVGTLIVVSAGHHLWPRFYFFALGFGALVAVRGALVAGRWIARVVALPPAKSEFVGVALALVMVLVSAKSVPYVYAPKQDYAGALAFVESQTQAGDAVVTVGLATYTYQSLYKMDWKEIKTVTDLTAVRAQAKRTWLLYTLSPQAESVYPQVMESVHRNFRVVKQFYGSVGDGTIFVCFAESPALSLVAGGILRPTFVQ